MLTMTHDFRIDVSDINVIVGVKTLKNIISKGSTAYDKPFSITIENNKCILKCTLSSLNIDEADKWVLAQANWILSKECKWQYNCTQSVITTR